MQHVFVTAETFEEQVDASSGEVFGYNIAK
jgi:hypothetical protein